MFRCNRICNSVQIFQKQIRFYRTFSNFISESQTIWTYFSTLCLEIRTISYSWIQISKNRIPKCASHHNWTKKCIIEENVHKVINIRVFHQVSTKYVSFFALKLQNISPRKWRQGCILHIYFYFSAQSLQRCRQLLFWGHPYNNRYFKSWRKEERETSLNSSELPEAIKIPKIPSLSFLFSFLFFQKKKNVKSLQEYKGHFTLWLSVWFNLKP